jgi:dienelactone hydrolase
MQSALRSLVLFLAILPVAASAALKSQTVEYKDGDTPLKGYLVYDDAISGKRPGVIVVHEWWGLNDYARKRADMLAKLGYVAFAVDMYGDDKVTEHAKEAKAWMEQITEHVDAWQHRALLGVDVLKKQKLVDTSKIAAIGYCFGGATVMEMAYSGADLKGVVSFHGSLPPATPEQQKHIKAKILANHGSKDSFEPPARVQAFEESLDAAGADWELAIYGGARHGFTNPDASKYGIANIQYNAEADRRSWALMQAFFKEIFAD